MDALNTCLRKIASQWPKHTLILSTPSKIPLIESSLAGVPKARHFHVEALRIPESSHVCQLVKDHAPTMIVALGGGSVLDSGKIAALGFENPGDLNPYIHEWHPSRALKPKCRLRACLIPTNFSSGAWASPTAVVYHEKQWVSIIGSEFSRLEVHILPQLGQSLNHAQLHHYAQDTILHWLEIYCFLMRDRRFLSLRGFQGWIEDFSQALVQKDLEQLFFLSGWLYQDHKLLTQSEWPFHRIVHAIQKNGGHAAIIGQLLPAALESALNKFLKDPYLEMALNLCPGPMVDEDVRNAILEQIAVLIGKGNLSILSIDLLHGLDSGLRKTLPCAGSA